MKISAKIDYACRAIFELSLHWPNQQPLQVHEIAQRQGIPMNFLIQILFNLRQLGYVRSARGKEGGYNLSKPPGAIKFNDLMRHFGPEPETKSAKAAHRNKACVIDTIWGEVDEAVETILENINFEDICDRARANEKTITYEI